jgi:hypothetical protein
VKAAVRLARRLVAFEISLYRSLFRWVTRRPHVPAGSSAWSYVGGVSVLLWAFIVVSAVELVVLHVVIPWEGVRLAADILSLWGLAWMLGFAASLHVYPHLEHDDGLRVRHGTGTDFFVPWDVVASAGVRERSLERSKAVQVDASEDGTVLSVVIASRTNVDLRLAQPMTVPLHSGEVTVDTIRLFADDPRALVGRLRSRR